MSAEDKGLRLPREGAAIFWRSWQARHPCFIPPEEWESASLSQFPILPRLVILPLMFIPRKVSRPNDVTRRLTATRPELVQESAVLQEDLKGKGKITDASSAASEELAALVHLGLSEYSVWINPDLTSSGDGCTYTWQIVQYPSLELIAVLQTYHWSA